MTEQREIPRTLLVMRSLSSELGGVLDSSITGSEEARGVVDNAGPLAEVMQWDSGDLSLIKGMMVQGEAARGQSNQRPRRVL